MGSVNRLKSNRIIVFRLFREQRQHAPHDNDSQGRQPNEHGCTRQHHNAADKSAHRPGSHAIAGNLSDIP